MKPPDLQRLVKGKTTQSEVILRLGEPQVIERLPEETVLIYEGMEAEDEGDFRIETTTHTRISLDATGVLKDYGQRFRETVVPLPSKSPFDEWPRRSRYPNDR